jgi:hypothetical protein
MRIRLRTVIVLVLASAGLLTVSPLVAQEGLTKQDRQGPVTVALTLLAPPADDSPLRVKVVLDTHSAGLDGIVLEQAVALQAADGSQVAPTAVEQASGAGHHRQAVLVFPAAGKGPVRIVVRNVGGVAERVFSWDGTR